MNLISLKKPSIRVAVSAFLTLALLALPGPLTETPRANAAAGPAACCTYILEEISFVFDYVLDTTKPPALSSFDVRVDGVSNPVTAIRYLNTIVYLSLTSTVFAGSTITLSYNAPAIDNTLSNNALQKTNGEDTISFLNLSVNNMGASRPEPNAPGTPTVVAGEESATITVTAPTGGRTPTSYEVTASPDGAKCTVTGASGSCSITGLTAGIPYTFTTVAIRAGLRSTASAASTAAIVLVKTIAPTDTGLPSWDAEPATDSETDAFTEGFWPSAIPGNIIITNEFGFTVDKKNGIKPKIRMKNYAGKITKMTITATYKDGNKNKKYKCVYAPFGSTKKAKTAKWKWYTPRKACVLPAPLVTALQNGTTTLSAKGKWTRQWVTSAKKARPDKTKIKARSLKYTVRARPAAAQ